ncbi:uncharacterized protein LOC115051341 [Echeneis naucrates]|uniref:uncharacterized protein LOC115051341 n=1 Tax=Echeneis naucrates TaxID=173247 RepID=UPI0011140E42|nr:uncharacterized protein LOC115051341 [Echeneis naucrates]
MAERTRKEEYLKTQEALRGNALKLITVMLEWSNKPPGSKYLVDEILHCIFFLGQVNNVPYSPESIIGDEEILEKLKERYPRPFKFYLIQLPRRSPFSCVMDMVVQQEGQENENRILTCLRQLLTGLEKNFLVSTTLCISQKAKNSERYYGVSMSTTGPNPGKIVIAASCLSNWDDYVADAVTTYYPVKQKKPFFDGTIKLPRYVRCQAFNIRERITLPPCRSCANLFGLSTNEGKEWDYGHCAEAESLSNLLKNDNGVKRETRQESPTCNPANRQQAIDSVHKKLQEVLRTVQFKRWDGEFYSPQVTN